MAPGTTAPRIGETVEVTIDTLGARGDGIAYVGETALFVPLTVPGERVCARIEARRGDGYAARAEAWMREDPGRQTPRCPHFGPCGGCTWQHLPATVYAAVKRDLLIAALARQGLQPGDRFLVEPACLSPPATRRRVRFAGLRDRAGVRLGLHPRAGHEVLDIAQCPVALPAIVALLDPCRRTAGALDGLAAGRRPAPFQVAVTWTDSGADVTWTLPRPPSLADRERLARLAAEADLARVSWRRRGPDEERPDAPEPVAERRPVIATFGGTAAVHPAADSDVGARISARTAAVDPAADSDGGTRISARYAVELPPDQFLQATRAGEAAIGAATLAAVRAAPRGPVADLFAGCGTLSLPLAGERAVHAADGDAAAITALDAAARRATGLRLTVERRDLARRPLLAPELGRFAACVLDPPRAGALAQARELARSTVATVVAVSCEPATLARDLRTLVDGGYAIERILPIDQFLWSPRLEAVAVLRR